MANLSLKTSAHITTTRSRMYLYIEPDRTAVVASITENTFPLPARTWVFADVDPSIVYYVRLATIDGSGNDIQTLIDVNVEAESAGSLLYLDPVELIADTTDGFPSGQSTYVFDGSGALDNLIGYKIELEHVGFGTQFQTQYTWDSTTGTLQLLDDAGDAYVTNSGERYYLKPLPKVVPGPAAPGYSPFTSVIEVSASQPIDAADFGKACYMTIDGSTQIELSLPVITTVKELKALRIKTHKGTLQSLVLTSQNPNAIDALEGARTKLYIGNREEIEVYRRGTTWEVTEIKYGGDKVGLTASANGTPSTRINIIELNGGLQNNKGYGARLYFDVVANLPSSERIAFVSWLTSDRTKYSDADAGGNYYVPKMDGYFERAVAPAGVVGTYSADSNKSHNHYIQTGGDRALDDTNFPGGYIPGRSNPDGRVDPTDMNDPTKWVMPNHFTTVEGGAVAKPQSVDVRKYVFA